MASKQNISGDFTYKIRLLPKSEYGDELLASVVIYYGGIRLSGYGIWKHKPPEEGVWLAQPTKTMKNGKQFYYVWFTEDGVWEDLSKRILDEYQMMEDAAGKPL